MILLRTFIQLYQSHIQVYCSIFLLNQIRYLIDWFDWLIEISQAIKRYIKRWTQCIQVKIYILSNERLVQSYNSLNTEKNKRVKASATSTQQPRMVPGVPKVLASPVSLDCPFLISPSVFSNVYIVRYWIYLSYNKILITV